MKRPSAIALLVLALAAVFLSVAAGRPGRGGAAPTLSGPAVGRLAPAFTLQALAGAPLALASTRGRPVLLNFWASWCTECRAELPALRRFQAALGSQVTLIGINVQQPAGVVGPYARQEAIAWPVLLDPAGTVSAAYRVHYLPTSFFLNANGVIRRIYTGPLTFGQLRAFLRDAGG